MTKCKFHCVSVSGAAPDIVRRGRCIRCDACTQKQVRKAIRFMQREYPKEFSQMIYAFAG